jgi:uncharacterized RDD family membrane protein YckC
MDNPQHDARYAPPQADVEDVVDATQGPQLASRSQRFFAIFLDTVFQVLALSLVSVLTPYNPFKTAGSDMWSADPAGAITGVLTFLLLNGYLLATRGQTLGKALLKIRIVRPSGEPASGARLALRYGVGFATGLMAVALWIYSLVDCLMIFRKSRRCLHDEIADTIVVKV